MRLRAFTLLQRPVASTQVIIMLLWAMGCGVFRDEPPDDIQIRNQEWRIVEGKVVITYDLAAKAEELYDVSVVLRKADNPSFRVSPKSVAGQVGRGRFAGNKRVIYWDHMRDLPQGLQGSDYFFEITVAPVGASISWVYYAAGGVALVGGLAVYFMSQESASTSADLPTPPARP